MKRILRTIPYVIAILVAFYLLPLGISDTGSAMTTLLIAIPVLCFLAAFLFGWRNGFSWWFVGLVAVLFVPTIWIYYNISAWGYTIVYAVFALVGSFLGKLMPKRG